MENVSTSSQFLHQVLGENSLDCGGSRSRIFFGDVTFSGGVDVFVGVTSVHSNWRLAVGLDGEVVGLGGLGADPLDQLGQETVESEGDIL